MLACDMNCASAMSRIAELTDSLESKFAPTMRASAMARGETAAG